MLVTPSLRELWLTLHGKPYFLFPDVLKRWSFQKSHAGIWSFLYCRERSSFSKKYTEIWHFLQTFWKDGIFKKGRWDMIFLVLSGKMAFFFSRKHDIFSLGRKWEMTFLKKYIEIWYFLCTRTGVTNVVPHSSAKKNQRWSNSAKIHRNMIDVLDWHPRKSSSNSLYFHKDLYRRFHALLSSEKNQET